LTVIEPFASREQALEAEQIAIRTEWPRYNVTHNGHRHPVADLRRSGRRIRRHEQLEQELEQTQ
jgi:hypothetical protein